MPRIRLKICDSSAACGDLDCLELYSNQNTKRLVLVCLIEGGSHRMPYIKFPNSRALDYIGMAQANMKVCKAVQALT